MSLSSIIPSNFSINSNELPQNALTPYGPSLDLLDPDLLEKIKVQMKQFKSINLAGQKLPLETLKKVIEFIKLHPEDAKLIHVTKSLLTEDTTRIN